VRKSPEAKAIRLKEKPISLMNEAEKHLSVEKRATPNDLKIVLGGRLVSRPYKRHVCEKVGLINTPTEGKQTTPDNPRSASPRNDTRGK